MRTALATLWLTLGLASAPAEAAWPKYLNFQTCVPPLACSGLSNTWTLFEDNSFVDQFGSGGTWLFANRFPGVWYYGFDWILLYDTGALYIGSLDGPSDLAGDYILPEPWYTYQYYLAPFDPPTWCTAPVPATGECP